MRLDPSPRGLLVAASAKQRQQPNRLPGKVGHQQRKRRVVDLESELLADDRAANGGDERPIGGQRQPEPCVQTDEHESPSPVVRRTLEGLYTQSAILRAGPVSGLMRVARRAGTAAPVAAMAASAIMAASVVNGSAGFRPYSRLST